VPTGGAGAFCRVCKKFAQSRVLPSNAKIRHCPVVVNAYPGPLAMLSTLN
jgi:hypothetical protein